VTTYEFCRNGDVEIAARMVGTGPPLVLLHGFSLSSDVWQVMGYEAPLLAAGWRLILVDIRGHGRSGKPHDPAAYQGGIEAADIAAVLDRFQCPRASVLGYSRGGRMALDFAVACPDRIERLVVGGGHGEAQDMGLFRRALSEGIEGWIAVIEDAAGPLPEPVRAAIAGNDIGALRAAVAVDRTDICPALGGVRQPCLFYCGDGDLEKDAIVRTSRSMPGGRFVEIATTNHMTCLQRADASLRPILSFLGTH
jgi:pimeloyl-ACP methyl ester carboxylesterase